MEFKYGAYIYIGLENLLNFVYLCLIPKDTSDILKEQDIDHPFIHVDLCQLPDYTRDHLVIWLKFRGDTLKRLDSERNQK